MTGSLCLRFLPYRASLLRQRFVPLPVRYTPATRRCISATAVAAQRRNDNFSTGYTNEYSIPAYGNGRGPIFDTRELHPLYPRDIKGRVDAYVVGQDKAKKAISTALFNHLKRCIRAEQQDERQRLSESHKAHQTHPEFVEQWQPRTVEDRLIADRADFQHPEFDHRYPAPPPPEPTPKEVGAFFREDDPAEFVKIDKNNLLFLGPTGSGKTYILETMSKILDLPMVICDCNALTQAGYIGQDVESCIQRLLVESGLDVQKAQRGIVVLDEFDKLAKKEATIGRDVAGEGVQQALLAMVHGSKITVNIKDAHKPAHPLSTAPYVPPNLSATLSSSSASKADQQFVVDTSNIIFVFCGAFSGLEKIIKKRVSKTPMGFKPADQVHPAKESVATNPVLRPAPGQEPPPEAYFDLASPEDLQAYGIIPELLGRIHDICALHPLSLDELYRILTEPRNNLVSQYRALFETYPSEVFFTKKALRAIAKRAADSKKGARGLQSEMLRVLQDAMFIAPVPYILVTAACVEDPNKLHYWGKDGRMELERTMREEDGEEIQPLHIEHTQAQAALGC